MFLFHLLVLILHCTVLNISKYTIQELETNNFILNSILTWMLNLVQTFGKWIEILKGGEERFVERRKGL